MGARRNRLIRVVALIVILAMVTPAVVKAQVAPPSLTLGFGLGFGPTSIEPLTKGVPVYSIGDQIWAQSYYNDTVVYIAVTPPSGTPVPASDLGPGQLEDLYTIAPTDPTGNWTLEAFTQTGASIHFTFQVENGSAALQPKFDSAGLQGDALSLGYSIPPTAAFDIQACEFGVFQSQIASFTLPPSIGGGMAVSMGREGVTISAPSALVPFSGWLELYASRSFTNGSSLVSEEVLAAQTPVLTLGANSSVTSALVDELNLRVGRYDLRAFVRGPAGLAAFEAPFLLTNASRWVSLTGCNQLSDVTSGSFALTSSMDATNSTWPRSVYLMYSVGGVDSYAEVNVPAVEGRVDLRASTGLGFPGAALSLSGSQVMTWSANATSLYFVGSSFPANVTVHIDYRGVTSDAFNVTVPGPYAYVSQKVDVGTLVALTKNSGLPQENATVYVSAAGGAPVAFDSGVNANETLTLPPGTYNVTVSYSGRSATDQVQVTSGSTSTAILDVSPPVPPYSTYGLVAVLVVALGVNLFIWRGYIERRATIA